jgi:uncharacterized membrane protein (DUF373 family)/hemoglobin-like flavoprotein
MRSGKKIKENYELTEEDVEILKGLRPLMKQHRDQFADDFYALVTSNNEMAEYFPNEEKLKHHKMLLAAWFMRLFNGTYDEEYFRNLRHVGKIHVDIKLEGHFVNAAMSRVRQFIIEVIDANIDDTQRESTLIAINKILDINLDVLTSSYRQAELKQYFLSYRLESTLINLMERFTHGLNLVLAIALAVVSIAVVALFVHDVASLFTADKVETAVVAALGSLLIIWMMIELLDTEISHLKGKKIPIKLFVGVVIVAFIRKVLIATLEHQDILEYASRVATLLILGIVYWLVTKADKA